QLRRKRDSPTQTDDHWRRFVCNLPTRSVKAAITEAEWQEARTHEFERIPLGEPVWLGLTPPRDGSSLDPHEVEARLLEVHKRNPVHTVVMDMSKAEQLAEWIKEEIGAEVVDHGTGNTAAVLDYDRFMEA